MKHLVNYRVSKTPTIHKRIFEVGWVGKVGGVGKRVQFTHPTHLTQPTHLAHPTHINHLTRPWHDRYYGVFSEMVEIT